MSSRTRWAALALSLTILAVGRPASALTPEEEATATRLMREGHSALERRELDAAERAFAAAHALARLPSSGIALAKVLAERGKLLQALQVLNAVQRMTPDPAWSVTSADGYREAIALAPKIEARIPSVVIDVPGADEAAVRVEVDGRPLKPPVLGIPRKLDPGRRRLVVERDGFVPDERDLELVEGAQQTIRVELRPTPVAPPPASPRGQPTPSSASDEGDGDGGRPLLVAGAIVGGVGLATLAGGVVVGVMADGEESDLAPSCPGGVCPRSLADELAHAEDLSTVANVLFVTGGVVAATGLTLVLVDLASHDADRSSAAGPRDATSARVRLGPAQIRLEGRF